MRAARRLAGAVAVLALTGCTSTVAGTASYGGPRVPPRPTADPNRPVTIRYEINHEIDPETRRAAQVYHQLHPAADLAALGATGDDFVPGVFQAATVGSRQVALPADMAPIGICYRRDLFARAGLPTGRDALAARWKTWQAYVNDGAAFAARVHDATYLDSSTSVFTAMVAGAGGYYGADGKPQYDTNPAVRAAFELAARAVTSGVMPRDPEFQGLWFTNLQSGRVATIPCFPGILPLLRGIGTWDLAPAPTAANLGTTYYAVSGTSRDATAAYAFVTWLTSTAEQRRTVKVSGRYPTRLSAVTAPDVLGATDRALAGAPTGRIFGAAAQHLPPVHPGRNPVGLQQVFERALQAVRKGTPVDGAWRSADLNAHATPGGN
jgi:cellobiose transport system substrate-binding protein